MNVSNAMLLSLTLVVTCGTQKQFTETKPMTSEIKSTTCTLTVQYIHVTFYANAEALTFGQQVTLLAINMNGDRYSVCFVGRIGASSLAETLC